jgi:hypothetical protein
MWSSPDVIALFSINLIMTARRQGRVGGESVRMTDSKGSGRKKAIGKRDAATGGGAQLGRVGPHVASLGASSSSQT